MRKFNTTGPCVPRKHYMVDISAHLERLRAMVDEGAYICLNRGRQYGKTTTLAALRHSLSGSHSVISVDFQGISSAEYSSEAGFVRAFARLVAQHVESGLLEPPEGIAASLTSLREGDPVLSDLFSLFRRWVMAAREPVVLIVDEVDSASNNDVFLDFLAQLRQGYIARDTMDAPAIQSVILAGVTDIRHLRAKIRPEGQHRVNSPWNIAVTFDDDMSLSAEGIAEMLGCYEAEHATGMDVSAMAQEIRDWTGGYPFLVSRLCQVLDEGIAQEPGGLSRAWTQQGLDAAVKELLSERNALFDSLSGKLESFPDLKARLYAILMEGDRMAYNADERGIQQLEMYGFARRDASNSLVIDNRVFETRLYDLFIAEEKMAGSRMYGEGELGRSTYVKDGRLDMRAVLEGFRRAFTQVFGPLVDRFPEKDGRELFLLFLKPIINGTGNYYIEAQTRSQTRTDVVVDYAGEQFVVELKIWRGPRSNEAGEKQVADYLDHFGLSVGYMLSFNFNKQKEPGMRRVTVGDKMLFEETL